LVSNQTHSKLLFIIHNRKMCYKTKTGGQLLTEHYSFPTRGSRGQ